jgi:proline dehydrogenase
MLSRSLVLKVTSWRWMERLVRKSFLFRPLVKRFIAGDTLDQALVACKDLADRGFLLSLDLLGENVKSVDEAIAAKNAYVAMLGAIDAAGLTKICNISIKLTQCGFDQGDDLAEKHFREILTEAAKYNNFVRADMEASEYTERTVALIEKVWPEHKNTGTVLQTYLYRTPDDLDRMIKLGARVRIVKGAYAEPASVAYPKKSDVDKAYVELSKKALHEVNYPAIATHDARIIETLKQYAAEQNISTDRFEFQMIYGVRRDLQEKLRQEGYNVRIYVPFGESWYPYFTRRLAERPANLFFIMKSMFRG